MSTKKPVIHDLDQLQGDYDRYRQQLCASQPGLAMRLRAGGMEAGESLSDLARGFDLILLDAYGVLNVGDRVLPGAVATVQQLKAMGKDVRVVTNNASQAPATLLERFHGQGFPLTGAEVITSGMTIRPHVAQSALAGRPYLLIGTLESRQAYAPPVDQEGPPAYLLLCSNRDYYQDQAVMAATEAFLARGGVTVLLANPDLVAPEADGRLNPVAGYTCSRWQERFDIRVTGLGKPFGPIFRQAIGSHPPHRVLMVGDTLDTDILGSAAMGMATCLVGSGIYQNLTVQGMRDLCRQKGIQPDFILASLANG